MKHIQVDAVRILAIDFCNRGLGFVVVEDRVRLVDWGVKRVRPEGDVRDEALAHIQRLFRLYGPRALVIEDVDDLGSRRRGRAVALTRAAHELAREAGVPVHRVRSSAVRKVFAFDGAQNKAQIATAVALQFPPLIQHLPPPRKPWMSEDYRFSIFDAAAFLITHLRQSNAPDINSQYS